MKAQDKLKVSHSALTEFSLKSKAHRVLWVKNSKQ
jgi:hypothetical protein